MNFPKIALRGSPTTIKQLETLGGYNYQNWLGLSSDYYYFISKNGNIWSDPAYRGVPRGYKLISHISELKSTKLFKLL